MSKDKVIVLIGPTAVGKTKLSIDIASRFGFEVISGDSMQIYQGMDILTGKITEKEASGIKHHMIDIKRPDENFSVSDFKNLVESVMETMHQKGGVPFIVGGTGHYIKALIHDYQFNDENSEEKQRLTESFENEKTEVLYDKLKALSPADAENVHTNNRQRIIRMLVKHQLAGGTREDTNYTPDTKYDTLIIGLTTERERLYNRINERVAAMFEAGLENEVSALKDQFDMSVTASGAIGYKEFLPYFEGEASLADVKEKIQQHSRQYAKRQLTFFRNQLDVQWFDADESDSEEVFKAIEAFIS